MLKVPLVGHYTLYVNQFKVGFQMVEGQIDSQMSIVNTKGRKVVKAGELFRVYWNLKDKYGNKITKYSKSDIKVSSN